MKRALLLSALVFAVSCPAPAAELQSQTLAAWETYRNLTEARIEKELTSSEGFLVRDFLDPRDASTVRAAIGSKVHVKKLETRNEEGGKIDIPDGLVHHWYGSVFVPGATVDAVLAWVQDYDRHHEYFDEVEESRLDSRQGDVFDIFLKLKRTKVITVRYNTEHEVSYRRLGPGRVASRSESTRIAEIDDAGKASEREKPIGNDRGYLWRLNSYWRFQQEDGGVVVECESISLSRDIPVALEWFVKPFITSVPRESLEAALLPLRNANTGKAIPSAPPAAELRDDTLSAWETYRKLTEARIDEELASSKGFLVRDFLDPGDAAAIRARIPSGAYVKASVPRESLEAVLRPLPSDLSRRASR